MLSGTHTYTEEETFSFCQGHQAGRICIWAVGGHIEEAYLAKGRMMLTQREGGNTCGVGKRRAQDRRDKEGEERRRGRRDRKPMSPTVLGWVARCHCVPQSMPTSSQRPHCHCLYPFCKTHSIMRFERFSLVHHLSVFPGTESETYLD